MPSNVIYKDDYLWFSRDPKSVTPVLNQYGSLSEGLTIYYNLSGHKTVMIEGSNYHLEPGELFISRGSEAYYICYDKNEQSVDALYFIFSPYLLRHLDPEFLLLARFYHRPLGEDNVVHCDTRQRQLFQTAAEHLRYLETTHNVNALRNSIFSYITIFLNEINSSRSYRAPHIDQEARKMLGYVNQHLTDDLSLDELSRHFYMSKACFCKRFKKYTGTTLVNYLTHKRLYKARDLLRRGATIAEVVEKCGFREYATFYQAHMRFYNYPPRNNRTTKENDPLLLNHFYQPMNK